MLAPCCKLLNDWVRKGDLQTRLKSIRSLSDPDASGELPFLVVSVLVQMSRGRKTILPFGTGASVSTKDFKAVSSTLFGLSLAAMYVFIKLDQDKWNTLLANMSVFFVSLEKSCSDNKVVYMYHGKNTSSSNSKPPRTSRRKRKNLVDDDTTENTLTILFEYVYIHAP